MGSLGTPEIIVIFVVALIVLGPERLPNIARQMGKAMGEFRRMSSGFQDEIRKAIDDPAEYSPSFPSRSSGDKDKGTPASSSSPASAGTRTPGDDPGRSGSGGPPSPHAAIPADTSQLPPPPDDPSRN